MKKKVTDKQRASTEGKKRSLANLKPWPKGVSGNPAGRPKSITVSEAYRKMLAQPMPNDKDGRTYAEGIAEQIIKRAAVGDLGAAKEITDRVEGKPRQSVAVDMTVADWREMAKAAGLSEEDVIREAKRLIAQSAADASGA